MTAATRFEHLTCLGCGCGCDDITVAVTAGRITDMTPVCPNGKAWMGDGSVPWEIMVSGQSASLEQAISAAAQLLLEARGRLLVYLGADVTSQAQRLAVATADLLEATVDSATSSTAAEGILVAQRRGRAGATFGELKNRADVILFWGVDLAQRYPRFLARYVEPAGTHVPGGRKDRTLIGVQVGSEAGLASADLKLTLAPHEEITALSLMRASLQGDIREPSSPAIRQAIQVADRLAKARYAVLVQDAEPTAERGNPLRAEALIALAQTLNGPTRAALINLRSGGNRVGSESVLTWQAGYPFSVDFTRGYPRYEPAVRGLERLSAGGLDAALVIGSPTFDPPVSAMLGGTATVAIGPRASRASFPVRVAIDTGVAGIHEAGTAYRGDEVPLQLRPPLTGQRSTTEVLGALVSALDAGLLRNRR